jgi:tetratricopeptide (TPR) repeat protein
LLVERARAFQALGLHEQRLAERERIVRLYPAKPNAYHNLAAALGDVGLPEDAERAARQAIDRGGNAPETWLVLARALQSQNRLDEAERAFAEAVRRRPGFAPALRDWSQLVWMRTGDLDRSLSVLNAGVGTNSVAELTAAKARLFEAAGHAALGYHTLVGRDGSSGPDSELLASSLAIGFDAGLALRHARRAERMAPTSPAVQRQLIDACLAASEPEAALAAVEHLLDANPFDQGLIASRWMAWRMLGDDRARRLYDYSAMVAAQPIDTPAGWATLADYLAELSEYLRGLHGFRTHPVDQSLRHGSQTSANLMKIDHPLLSAFRHAVDRPIREYLAAIGEGSDALRSRNVDGYRFAGMWSVKLSPGGFHVGHVHPQGWISSACYIDLPPAIGTATHDGWLQFGEPGIPTYPPLEPEWRIQPADGVLALFPSFMWHSTAPFGGDRPRLTIAFDIVPSPVAG